MKYANQVLIKIIENAIQKQCSDIYFLPRQNEYLIQFCASNQYFDFKRISFEEANVCINFLKFKANMNISDHRRSQSGAWKYQDVNLRLSSVADFRGYESLVIRLIYNLEKIACQRYYDKSQWHKIIKNCYKRGLILFSGPTGSGKTSSMYELARYFADQQIISIEDPIEIYSPNILQIQVNQQAQMDYEHLIKLALRHHPEILIIGEIRDKLTAQAAIRAALSGHLVLSTVHARNVYGVIARLLNLGISLIDLEHTLRMINYQRLIQSKANEIKVLFDQLDLDKQQVAVVKNKIGVTKRWKHMLTNLYLQGRISEQTYEKFIDG